jgi:chorismate mutase/prephenate dehydratase
MNLDELRIEIDRLDDELLTLLNQRMEVVKKVGEFKHKTKGAIYRPEREKQIIDRLEKQNQGLLNRDAIEALFMEVFAVSRNLELPEKVVYLGPEGSYSHQAAEMKFGAMSNYMPISSIEGVFKVLENKEAKFGVVPIENNTDGAVGATLDSLAKYSSLIVAEEYMDIHHSFASVQDDLKKIKRIYSHPQGYNQCIGFLEEHFLTDVEFVPTRSTSAAAKRAVEDPDSAAICSKIAAKLHHLPILFEKIEDNEANRTRFLILSDFKNGKSEFDKTSILAKLDDKAGSLVEFLQKFKDVGINLLKIESRPIKEEKFKSMFFIDFEGHGDDENFQKLLNADDNYSIKWLGSYVDGEKK